MAVTITSWPAYDTAETGYHAQYMKAFGDIATSVDGVAEIIGLKADMAAACACTTINELGLGLKEIGTGIGAIATQATAANNATISYLQTEVTIPGGVCTGDDGAGGACTGVCDPQIMSAAAANYLAITGTAQITAEQKAEAEANRLELEKAEHAKRLLYWTQAILGMVSAVLAMKEYVKQMNNLTALTDKLPGHMQSMIDQLNAGLAAQQAQVTAEITAANGARLAKFDEKTTWACAARDELWTCFTANFEPHMGNLTTKIMAAFDAGQTSLIDAETKLGEVLDVLKADYEGAVSPAINALVPNLSTELGTMIGTGSAIQAYLKLCGEELKAKYDAGYGGETDMAMTALATGKTLGDLIPQLEAWLTTHHDKLLGIYDSVYAGNEATLASALMVSATGLVAKLEESETWSGDHSKDMEGIYDGVYRAQEAALSVAVMQCATDLVAKLKESEDWTAAFARDDESHFDAAYRAKEDALAAAVHDTATALVPLMDETQAFLALHARDDKACYDNDYKAREKALTAAIFECATELAPMMVEAQQWLADHTREMEKHWQDVYKEKEAEFIMALIDSAIENVDKAKDALDDLSEKKEEFIEIYHNCYEQAECKIAPIIMNIGGEAQEKHREEWEWLTEKGHGMYDKWEESWYPCDRDNLLEHCGHWQENNPLHEIHENSDDMRDIAVATMESYLEDGLPCEVKYVGEVCGMPVYEPDFCAMESTAVLHVRREFDRQRDELTRSVGGYSHGVAASTLARLAGEQVKAEAGAIQAANRFERWWKVQEDNRRHRYHQDVMNNIVDRWPQRSFDGFTRSTEGQSKILASMHDSILRGYTYLQNSQNYEKTAIGAIGNALEGALQMTRIGHYWPDAYLKAASQLEIGYDNTRRESIDALNLGWKWMESATRSEIGRVNAIDAKLGHGLRSADLGHDFLAKSTNAESNRQAVLNQSGTLGLRSTDLGHFFRAQSLEAETVRQQLIARARADGIDVERVGQTWMAYASTSEAQRQQAIVNGERLGADMIPIGQRYLAMATDSAQVRSQLQSQAEEAGLRAIGHGHDLLARSADKTKAAMSAALEAGSDAINILHEGTVMAQVTAGGYTSKMNAAQNTIGHAVDAMKLGLEKARLSGQINENAQMNLHRMIHTTISQINDMYSNTSANITNVGTQGISAIRNVTQDLAGHVGGGLSTFGSGVTQLISSPNLAPYQPESSGNYTGTITSSVTNGMNPLASGINSGGR